ncbi:MAG: bifunctional (p)ppGpp synthetase/guanosine-3',5'-bis(diphosphate) 3'-pyrophosphohydrolase [Oscillospiraceae bacterium]|nr:bifunctional (p)ppGpp synthetase/guanosine-3',5'-bis(diphosphate) 3'-pyrophosphohydrolase [Oscillospiraceae bacterium]
MGNESCTINMLIQKILDDEKQYDMSKIISAYEFAAKAHEGQKRSSGEPYIVHPVSVSFILLDLGMDTDTICAAMLHDVVEDTPVTLEEIKKHFGQDVAMLVDGVTKLSNAPIFNKDEQLAENVRKILLAMSQDIRVMIIKLCDRLHNMRTLACRPGFKQRKTALETMNIYAPIAHRLGIRAVKEELEDLAFKYLDPYAYSEIEHLLEIKKDEREAFIATIKSKIAERFKTEKFEKEPQIDGRVKSIYGIYKKIYVNRKNIEEVYDKYAVRVIVSTVAECYNVLGIIHDMFTPIPNRFKDYISTPKANMYQSLHTSVLGREGIPFEVQIRTWDMHYTAEYGIAAHWKYKEGIQSRDKMEQRLAWIRQVIEAQQTADDVEEIVRIIKTDLATDDIVVFTPKADNFTMPVNSTIIDFAYRVHTEIGHRTMGAKVDGKIVPLDYKLHTGDIVEILTTKDEKRGPNRAWLEIAQTNEAKSKIRSWFKKECREENIAQGKAELEREFQHYRMHVPENELETFLQDDLKRHSCNTLDDFYASIGYGGVLIPKIMQRLKDDYIRIYGESKDDTSLPAPTPKVKKKKQSNSGIIFDDSISNFQVRFSQCCNPLPGDDIIGFVTRGHGVSVHKKSCPNYIASIANGENADRWKKVEWSETTKIEFHAVIEVLAIDRTGMLQEVITVISEARIPIYNSTSRRLKNGNAVFRATVAVTGKEQLESIMKKLDKVKDVITVTRVESRRGIW